MGNEFDRVEQSAAADAEDNQVAQLEEALEGEKAARRQERFATVLVAIILIDIHVFSSMPTWGGPIAILILEVLLLILLGRKLDIPDVERWIDRWLNSSKNG